MAATPAPQRSTAAAMQVRVLGPIDIVAGGHSVVVRSERVCRLLALLAMNANSAVSFGQIVDSVWEEPPSSARQQVYNVVASLRSLLAKAGGEAALVRSGSGYQLTLPDSAVDMLCFQAHVQQAEQATAAGLTDTAIASLRKALGYWRGPAADGLTGHHLAGLAARLDEQRLAAAEWLAELQIHSGDAATSVADLKTLVAEFPLRESLRAMLMRALQNCGRDAEAVVVFEEARRLLADELGLDPGPELREVHQQLLGGATQTQPASVGVRPAQAGRSYLPRDIPEFTGRTLQIGRLLEAAGRAGTTALVISAIDGMGGVGKTALAVHVAHQLADRYPDGEYFIDLQGFSAGAEPLEPLQALNHLLRSFGLPPELIRPDLAGRSEQWRSCLAGARAILLLDNALDIGQVRPLLPGAGTVLVLISSRRRMTTLEGALPLSLDVMPEAEAVTLFGEIVGQHRVAAEPDATAAAVSLCGYLPLAIQVAAAQTRQRSSWSIAYVVEQLRDERSRRRLLSAGDRHVLGILAWSYRSLTPRQQSLFRLLNLLPGPDFDAYAVAALADLTLADAQECLEELFEVNLLKPHATDRYRLHDLVRDCSRAMLAEHGEPAEPAAATDRLLDYYVRSTAAWCGPIARAGHQVPLYVNCEPRSVRTVDTSADAATILEVETRNIIAAIDLAARTSRYSHVWQLTCALLPYVSTLGYGGDVDNLLQRALAAARTERSGPGESALLMGLAQVRQSNGAIDEAVRMANAAADLSQAQGNRSMEAFQRTALGIIHLDDNRFEEAYACFAWALRLVRAANDRSAEADLTNNLGVISRELGQFDEALDHFHRTLELDKDSSMVSAQVLTMVNIARVLHFQGNYAEALEYHEQACELSRLGGNAATEAVALTGTCAIYRVIGELTRSLADGRAALDLARAGDRFDVEADALSSLGDTYLSLGEADLADELFEQVGRLGTKYNSARYVARADEGHAHVLLFRRRPVDARRYWARALNTYPGGVEYAHEARQHLMAGEGDEVTCWRCAVVTEKRLGHTG